MTEPLTAALERSKQPAEVVTVLDLIERQKPEMEKLLHSREAVEWLTRTCLTEMRRNPKLYDCAPASLLGGLMVCAQLDLAPGPLGHVYLVPFKGEVQLIVGYKGMIELAYRSGRVKEVVAKTVWSNEPFTGLLSDERGDHFKHEALPPAERGDEPKAWWARARLTTGGVVIGVIYPEDAEAARKRSPAGSKNTGPWSTDYDAMARKTAVRRLSAFLPQSPQLARGLDVDEHSARYVEGMTDGELEIEGGDDA